MDPFGDVYMDFWGDYLEQFRDFYYTFGKFEKNIYFGGNFLRDFFDDIFVRLGEKIKPLTFLSEEVSSFF